MRSRVLESTATAAACDGPVHDRRDVTGRPETPRFVLAAPLARDCFQGCFHGCAFADVRYTNKELTDVSSWMLRMAWPRSRATDRQMIFDDRCLTWS